MIGRTNTGGGGGGGLNFKVVGGTTAPSNPKENMIWINTSSTITDWVFSATQPTAATGRVWISIGTESATEFNALKKNGIQVYPLSAKQYVSGTWVTKTAKSYQNSKWVSWWNGELYYSGNEWENITGGWMSEGKAYSSGSGSAPVITRSATRITAKHNTTQCTGILRTSKAVDPTGVKTIKATGEFYNATGTNGNVSINVWSAIGTYYPDNRVATTPVPMNTKLEEITVDVSGLQSGSYYVGFVISSGSSSSSGVNTFVGMDSCVLIK